MCLLQWTNAVTLPFSCFSVIASLLYSFLKYQEQQERMKEQSKQPTSTWILAQLFSSRFCCRQSIFSQCKMHILKESTNWIVYCTPLQIMGFFILWNSPGEYWFYHNYALSTTTVTHFKRHFCWSPSNTDGSTGNYRNLATIRCVCPPNCYVLHLMLAPFHTVCTSPKLLRAAPDAGPIPCRVYIPQIVTCCTWCWPHSNPRICQALRYGVCMWMWTSSEVNALYS